MWFSPLKGAHLTLGQLDKTLPVDGSVAANKNIKRGSFVYINAVSGGTAITPRFALYTANEAVKPNAVPYIALMGYDDFQAGMAGNIGQAPIADGTATGTLVSGTAKQFLNPSQVAGAQGFEGPRITAISVLQPAEYQTSAFENDDGETTPTVYNYYVGCPLTISNNGKLMPYPAAGGKNIVGYVTAAKHKRWVNDLGSDAAGARISGGNVNVINFSTAWIPVASTGAVTIQQDASTKEITGKGTAPAALNVGAPKIEKTEKAK